MTDMTSVSDGTDSDSTVFDGTVSAALTSNTLDDGATAVPTLTKSVRIASMVQIAGAVLLLGLLFPEWVRGGRSGLEGNGGGGFGVLALITGLVVLYSAVQGLRGRRTVTRIFGPNQLAVALPMSMFFSNLVFLWVFSTGGAPKWVYVASNAMAYAGILGLFSVRADKPPALPDRSIRLLGLATVVLGVALAAAPMLEYTKLSSVNFTGYEPGAPRIGLLFLLIGGGTVFYGMHRVVRGERWTDLGPFVLWPHVTIGLGVLATAPALAWMISGLWGNDFDPGIGVYLSVVLGLALVALGVFEAAKRQAKGI